ncbi:TPA: hypothetical protein HA331_01935 [Pyrococcus horikoshii]|uniref:Uncharacterized protein n=1 Tax=Pyrococcus horikoshii TaxID=53953 RepID=A0A832WIS5_PYRHR|nr:hypothetical protein [Pyrococcus horikoshii]
MKMKVLGIILYLSGLVMSIVKPPIERLACMVVPSGEVCTGVNPIILSIELGLILLGSMLLAQCSKEKLGWMAVSTGVGIAIIGGYSGLSSLVLLGAVLGSMGLVVYKLRR